MAIIRAGIVKASINTKLNNVQDNVQLTTEINKTVSDNFGEITGGIRKVVDAIKELLNIFLNLSKKSDEIIRMFQILNDMASQLRGAFKDIMGNSSTINTVMFDISRMFSGTTEKFINLIKGIEFINTAVDTLSEIGKVNEEIIIELDGEIKKFKV